MAITLEQVERLREKSGASYEDCKTALERANGNLLDAVIFLERQGKNTTHGTTGYTYTTRTTDTAAEDVRRALAQSVKTKGKGANKPEVDWRDWLREVGEMGLNLLRHSTVNQLEVWRHDKLMTSVPVLILALLLVFAFWITIPLLIVGFFTGCRYRFVGPDLGKEKVNDVMDNVSATVGDMVGHVKREFDGTKKKAEQAGTAARQIEREVDDLSNHLDDLLK